MHTPLANEWAAAQIDLHLSSMAEPEAADGDVREQDRFLPVANISRIMKRSLPPNAKIAKDAKETLQESVSEFISFITSEASDKCQQEKRKTINGDDLLWAMGTLGFDKYIEPLRLYLLAYRAANKGAGAVADEEAEGGAAAPAHGSKGGGSGKARKTGS